MCQTRTINLPWTTLYSDVTADDGVFLPVSGWMDAASVRRLRVTFEVAATTDANGIIKPGIQYANAESHWCGDATHVVATVFCTDPADRTIPPSMSRVLLINFKDPQNPVHYDVTAAVGSAFRGEGGNRRWRGIFSVCRNVG